MKILHRRRTNVKCTEARLQKEEMECNKVKLELKQDKQIQRIVVPRFRGLIVWGAIIKVLYQCQNFWYEWKGIITRNVHVHVKYESHISNGAQVTSIVKV